MLGSASEAEDAVQETMLRAWHNPDRFERRAASGLALLDGHERVSGHAGRRPPSPAVDIAPAGEPAAAILEPPAGIGVPPTHTGPLGVACGDPAEVAIARDTVRLAFVAALQLLPPKQRAVLILHEVLSGRRRRSPNYWRRASRRSTAPCKAPARRSRRAM